MTNPSRTATAAPDEPSDAELIAATRGGDTAAFGTLYLRHVDAANRMARTLVSDSSAADDLVAEAFARLLIALRNGNGPDQAFRAYLLTSVRNARYDQARRDRRLEVTDDITRYETGEPFRDTATEGLERALAARAFARLPERFQTVLWHTAVENEKPAAVAPLLGLSPNAVSALAYRARERLRELYLQEHITDTADPDCRWAAEHLGPAVRGSLSTRDRTKIDRHLDTCSACRVLFVELTDINRNLGGLLAPVVVGTTWAAYLGVGAAKGGVVAGMVGAVAGWFQHLWHAVLGWWKALLVKIGPRNAAIGGGAVAVVAAALLALLLVSSSEPNRPPRAAAPAASRRPPGNPPASNPPAHTPHRPPASNPPAHPPARRHPSASASPAPSRPPYRVTTPALSTGTLTAGDTDGRLPITISNPRSTGGTGGGFGFNLIPIDPGGTPSHRASPTPTPAPPGGSGIDMTVTLPAPMRLVPGTTSAGDGWSCRPAPSGARCRHAALRPGSKTVAALPVDVGDVAGFQPVGVRLAVAGGTTSDSFTVVVSPAGMSTAYASTGSASVAAAGNRFDTCNPGYPCHDDTCRPGPGRGWHHGWSCPSQARLDLPPGAHVEYASLTWSLSGIGVPGSAGTLAVAGPRGTDRTVRGSAQGGGQWRADVTDLVADDGAGTWSVTADTLLASGGWGLLVVVSVPGGGNRNVAVFEGRSGADPVPLRVSGPAGGAEAAMLTWGGSGTLRLGGARRSASGVAGVLRATVGPSARGSASGDGALGGLALTGPR